MKRVSHITSVHLAEVIVDSDEAFAIEYASKIFK